eukprot:69743_1
MMLLLLVLVCTVVTVYCRTDQSYWLKYPESPVLAPGPNGTWDAWEIGTMTICQDKNFIYHMYYEAGPSSLSNLAIGHATSKDGISWSKDPANPVLNPGPKGNWDDGATWDPFCLYQNGIFKLWYGGEHIGHTDYQWGFSTSTDGTHFKKFGETGQISFFNDTFAQVEDDHVLYIPGNTNNKDRYYIYYWQRAEEPWALMVAFGTNETNFDFDNAVFVYIEGEIQPSKFPQVFIEDNIWFMYYAQFNRSYELGGRTGYAECPSKDGIHFIAHNTSVIDGQDAFVYRIQHDALYYMYYGPKNHFDSAGDEVDLAILNGTLQTV